MTTYIPSITIPDAIFLNPVASTLLPIALGSAVGYATRPKKTQETYRTMKQPPLNPPPWIFGPVWTTLYGIMGYTAHRVATIGLSSFQTPSTIVATRHSMTLYTIQLGLNLVWMPLFFGIKRPALATVDILSLVGVNGYLAYLWGSIDGPSGWLQVPYLAWLSFATYLCVGAGHLNNWDFEGKDMDRSGKRD